MTTNTVCTLGLIVILLVGLAVGCCGSRQVDAPMDLKKAFSLAYDEFARTDGVSDREFKLTVRKDIEVWAFSFVFLPETPSDEFLVTVSNDGEVVGTSGY